MRKMLAGMFILALAWHPGALLHGEESAPVAAEESREFWYNVTFNGHKAGYGHIWDAEDEWKGVRYSSKHFYTEMRTRRDADVSVSSEHKISYYDPEETLLVSRNEKRNDDTTSVEETEYISENEFIRRVTAQGKTTETRHGIDEEDVESPETFVRKLLKTPDAIEMDKTYRGKEYDEEYGKTQEWTVTFTRRDMEGDAVWYTVMLTSQSFPGGRAEIVLNQDNDMRRLTIGPMLIQMSTKVEAMAWPNEIANISMKWPVNVAIDDLAIGAIDAMTVELTLTDTSHLGLFELDDACCRGVRHEDDVRLTLQARPAPARGTPRETPGDELKDYLGATDNVQCEDPAIRKQAREITDSAKGPVAAADAIAKWLKANITPTYEVVNQTTALDVLNMKKGDCAEFSVLFCALARAAGIPTREVTGIVFTGEDFTGHAWNEIHVAGTWWTYDATRGGWVGDARYMKFGEINQAQDEGAARFMALMSGAEFRVTGCRLRGVDFDATSDAMLYRAPETPGEGEYCLVCHLRDAGKVRGLLREVTPQGEYRVVTTAGTAMIPPLKLASMTVEDALASRYALCPEMNFRMPFPEKGWRLNSEDRDAAVARRLYFDSRQTIGMAILVEDLNYSLNTYEKTLVDNFENSMDEYERMTPAANCTFAGRPARQWLFKGIAKTLPLVYHVVIFQDGNRMGSVRFWTTEDLYQAKSATFNQMIRDAQPIRPADAEESK